MTETPTARMAVLVWLVSTRGKIRVTTLVRELGIPRRSVYRLLRTAEDAIPLVIEDGVVRLGQ
jgi:predicted DNA-binding transcriptional regulator